MCESCPASPEDAVPVREGHRVCVGINVRVTRNVCVTRHDREAAVCVPHGAYA